MVDELFAPKLLEVSCWFKKLWICGGCNFPWSLPRSYWYSVKVLKGLFVESTRHWLDWFRSVTKKFRKKKVRFRRQSGLRWCSWSTSSLTPETRPGELSDQEARRLTSYSCKKKRHRKKKQGFQEDSVSQVLIISCPNVFPRGFGVWQMMNPSRPNSPKRMLMVKIYHRWTSANSGILLWQFQSFDWNGKCICHVFLWHGLDNRTFFRTHLCVS